MDGFRFDIMSCLMVSTMETARDALRGLTLERDGVDGSLLYLYGEGWDFGEVCFRGIDDQGISQVCCRAQGQGQVSTLRWGLGLWRGDCGGLAFAFICWVVLLQTMLTHRDPRAKLGDWRVIAVLQLSLAGWPDVTHGLPWAKSLSSDGGSDGHGNSYPAYLATGTQCG